MPLLSATIRIHSICCQRLCFSIFFFHELHFIPFYWSLHFLRCSAQNRTVVLIFSWSFMEFWIEVKLYFTYSYLYPLIQHSQNSMKILTFVEHLDLHICSVEMLPLVLFFSLSLFMVMIPVHVLSTCPYWITVSFDNFSSIPLLGHSRFILSSDRLSGSLSLVIISRF